MRLLRCTVAIGLGLLFTLGTALAQSNPPNLDDQLRSQLALGDAFGCVQFLRLPAAASQDDVDDAIDVLQAAGQIGNELAAICSPSAVASASGMGGALDTVQATKTVSQFRLVRRRIDSRLKPPARPQTPPTGGRQLFPLSLLPSRQVGGGSGGIGIFGQFGHEWKDRTTSTFDLGYDSGINSFLGGVDYAFEGGVVGGWMGYAKTKGEFNRVVPLVARLGVVEPVATAFLSNPETSSQVCGGLSGGGDLSDKDLRFGGFAARSWKTNGFFDVSVSYDRRSHAYTRNVCTIEVISNPLAFVSGIRFRDADGDGVLDNGEVSNANTPVNVLFVDSDNDGTFDVDESVNDDVYAGAISGKTKARESAISGRVGYDFRTGSFVLGPRAIFTHTSTKVDGYTETGRSTVANDIRPVALDPGEANFTRQLGGPVGLELAYDDRRYRSDLLQLGTEASFHVYTSGREFAPFASVYWRREFGNEFVSSTVRMAQDLRTNPVRFSFSNNGPDRSSVDVSGGLGVIFDNGLAIQATVSGLLFDRFIKSTAVTGGVRWRL
jgi:uncharacterized protein YhjY with autotransporter beta-barrel domain